VESAAIARKAVAKRKKKLRYMDSLRID